MQIVVEDLTIFLSTVRHIHAVCIELPDAVDEHNARPVVSGKHFRAARRKRIRFVLSNRDGRLRNDVAAFFILDRSVKIQNPVAAEVNVGGVRTGRSRIIAGIVVDRTEFDRTALHRQTAEMRVVRTGVPADSRIKHGTAVSTEFKRCIGKRLDCRTFRKRIAEEVVERNRALLKRNRAREAGFVLFSREHEAQRRIGECDLNSTAMFPGTVRKDTAKNGTQRVRAVNRQQRIL